MRMKHAHRLPLILAVAASLTATAHADIIGFPIPGWKVNQWDGASASPVNPPHSITLTTTTSGQSRSTFNTARQDISQFAASFTYTFSGTASSRMGAAFVLHNRPAGAETVATGLASGVSTNLGYSDLWGTFGGRSVAVTIESAYSGAGSSSSGVYTGGNFGGGSSSTLPLAFSSGNPIDFNITYNGFLLRMTAEDTVTGAVYNAPAIAIDLPSILGDGQAFVGFTGSTNGNTGTSQTFSNFRFTGIPAPASLPVLGMAAFASRRRR